MIRGLQRMPTMRRQRGSGVLTAREFYGQIRRVVRRSAPVLRPRLAGTASPDAIDAPPLSVANGAVTGETALGSVSLRRFESDTDTLVSPYSGRLPVEFGRASDTTQRLPHVYARLNISVITSTVMPRLMLLVRELLM
jgi:hypothetical protein